jgi:glycosyltransferase involved in cell wall biosynthesis
VRVLARSFLDHHPEGRFIAFIVDDPLGAIGQGEVFNVLRPRDLELTAQEFRAMTLYYDVTEISTALKPWVMERVLVETDGPVLYLDPDCVVFDSLDFLGAAATKRGIVLTPHLLSPMPRDGLGPDERQILWSGAYNLGFLGLAKTGDTDPFLRYWKERLRFDAIIDPTQMLFTDQRWIDLVPGMFEHHIERDPGCNVAYWNAHERALELASGVVTAAGRPLRFFHYSGFEPDHPQMLSKHAGEHPRLLLSEQPILRLLCSQYVEQLKVADDDQASRYPYRWDYLPNGLRLNPMLRRFLREAFRRGGQGGPPNPADEHGITKLVEWLLEPDDRLPRLAGQILAIRPDVQAAMPDPANADAERFANWLRVSGSTDHGIDPWFAARLARAVGRGAPPRPSERHERNVADREPVVEVIGFVNAELGIGEAARRLVGSLGTAGVKHCVTGYHRHTLSRLEAAAPPPTAVDDRVVDVVISCVNADLFPTFCADLGPARTPRGHHVGLWFWELDQFPQEFHASFGLVDEVWCASEFVARSLRRHSPVDVVKIPMPIVAPHVDRRLRRADLGLPEGFVFLFIFDFLSIAERKNPFGLVEAFSRAFAIGEGPTLVIKSINGSQRIRALERLRLAAISRPDIVVIDRYMSQSEIAATAAASDCYVSLHRSEGFGLTLADAMALGVPVIATDYGGNMEFMDDSNSVLVPSRMVEVGTGCEPYPAAALWADPDLDAAADAMRRLVDDHDYFVLRSAAVRAQILNRFSLERCGKEISCRLDRIRARRRTGSAVLV